MPETEPILEETNSVGPMVVLLNPNNLTSIAILVQVGDEGNPEEIISVGPTGAAPSIK